MKLPNHTLIVRTAIQYLMPLMLLFAFYLLLRGHNAPGGGFVGGLVASAAFALHAIAEGVPTAREELGEHPRKLIGVGLLMAFVGGAIGLVWKGAFLQGVWASKPLPILGKVGTPLLFDLGVCLVVIGVTLKVIFSLFAEFEKGEAE